MGWYCGNCRAVPDPAKPQTPTGEIRQTVENTVAAESIIGPNGQPLWSVTAALHRPGMPAGTRYTETINVRAVGGDGALALGKEMLLDWIDGEAYQITEEGE